MFHCSLDEKNLAAFCCACALPLPYLCTSCIEDHRSKPGLHFLLPLSVQPEIASSRDFARLQRKLHDLILTHRELGDIMSGFQRAKADIEAAFEEITQLVVSTKEKYLADLSKSASLYEQRFNDAMQECTNNAWKTDFQPSNSLEEALWGHIPGKEPSFGFSFQRYVQTDLIGKIFNVKWLLPFPDISYPKDVFPVKIKLQSSETSVILVDKNQSLAEVKSFLKARNPNISSEDKFILNGQQLQDSGTLGLIGSGSELCLQRPQYQLFVRTNRDEIVVIVAGNDRNIDKVVLSRLDKSDFSQDKSLTEANSEGTQMVATHQIPPNSLISVGLRLARLIQLFVKTPTGALLTLEMNRDDSVIAVKGKIRGIAGYSPLQQVLVYAANKLEDNRTLEDYGVRSGDTLHLTLREEEKCFLF
jgi:hypothetical protein